MLTRIIIFVVLLALPVYSTIINVPADSLTIQSAIDGAVDGDTIAIAAGVYTGEGNREISTYGKAISIKGEQTNSTILDGEGLYTIFNLDDSQFIWGIDSTTVISDLTIQNATTGIYSFFACPKLVNLKIQQCSNSGIDLNWAARLNAMGISIADLSIITDESLNPLIFRNSTITSANLGLTSYWGMIVENCEFQSNLEAAIWKESNNSYTIIKNTTFNFNGFAIHAYDNQDKEDITIDSCLFIDNGTAVRGSFILSNSHIDGGFQGFYASMCGPGGGEYEINNCLIENLTEMVIGPGYGGANVNNSIIRNNTGSISYADPGSCCAAVFRFTDCKIYNNGGGISIHKDSNLGMSNCLYENNGAPIWAEVCIGECRKLVTDSKGSIGISNCTFLNNPNGAILVTRIEERRASISNTIVANNGAFGFKFTVFEPLYRIECCDFYANDTNFVGIPDQIGTNGNISVDPWFCFPDTGNYNLYDISRCAADNNSCSQLIGAYDIGCIYDNRTWHVSTTGDDSTGDGSYANPFATIQHGIEMAFEDDTVLVTPGTYLENVRFIGGNITLGSMFLTTGDSSYIESTIIDGNQSGSVVTFDSGEDTTCVLTGFTLTNGNFTIGGGIHCLNSNPKIVNNDINNNQADGQLDCHGGGIYCDNSSPIIKNNFIDDNQAKYSGGGIYFINNSNPSLSYNTIINNHANDHGGGICCMDSANAIISFNSIGNNSCSRFGGGIHTLYSDPTISNNLITQNHALEGGGINSYYTDAEISENIISHNTAEVGAGLYFQNSSMTLNGDIIKGNIAQDAGGGIISTSSNLDMNFTLIEKNTANNRCGGLYLGGASTSTIANCTIVLNNASASSSAIYFGRNLQVLIENTIIAYNDSSEAITCGDSLYVPTISCSDIYGNPMGDWTGYIADQAGQNGNLSSKPWFCHPDTGNYQIYNLSPCAATNNTCGQLIGAYDVGCEQTNRIWHVATTGNDLTGDGSYADPFATIQHGIDMAFEYDTVLVAPGTYVENVHFTGYNITLGSMYLTTDDSSYIETTIIDGNQSGSVVTFDSGEDTTCVLTGFTLTNGAFAPGAGIHCSNSNPKIIRNKINHNSTHGGVPGYGGGIYCSNSSPLIKQNYIENNWCMLTGGGIFCANNSNPIISENIIRDNSTAEFYGGGIACQSSAPYISDNLISGNRTHERGGGIYCSQSNPTIVNNTISGNRVWNGHGGGLWCSDVAPIINNNVFKDNAATNGGGISSNSNDIHIENCAFIGNTGDISGGGIYFTGASNPGISNCTFVNNSSPTYGSAIFLTDNVQTTITNTIIAYNDSSEAITCNDSLAIPTITCSDIFGNELGDWTGYIADQAGQNGNLSKNPLFCFPDTGNYHIYDLSPCAPANNICSRLIGAYDVGCEYTNHVVYISPTGNDITGDGSHDNPFATIQYGLDLVVDADTVMLLPGTYTGPGNTELQIYNKDIFLMGEADASSTIIEANDSTKIITFGYDNYSSNTYISDISFLNASTAITNLSSNLVLNNCILENNSIGTIGTFEHDFSFTNCNFVNNSTAISNNESWDDYSIDSCSFNGNGTCLAGGAQISNSSFNDGGLAFLAHQAFIYVENCNFNDQAGGIVDLFSGVFDISNSTISGVQGLIATAGGNDPNTGHVRIDSTYISNNIGGFEFSSHSTLIMNYSIYANNSKGLSFDCHPVNNGVAITNSIIHSVDTTAITYKSPYANLNIKNSVISNNNGYGLEFLSDTTNATLSILNNDFYNNTPGNYSGLEDQTGTNGNISADPLFIGGTPYDFNLSLASPCIDSGDPTSPLDPDSTIADIGVYPFLHGAPELTTLIAPLNGEIISPSGNLIWTRVENPYLLDTVYYAIQFDDDSLFASVDMLIDSMSAYNPSPVDTISAMLSELDTVGILQDNYHYFWRINAVNRLSDQSGYTDGLANFYYNIENNPPLPPLSGFSPSGDTTITTLTPTLSWDSATDPDPDDTAATLCYIVHLVEDTSTGDYYRIDTTTIGVTQVTYSEDLPDDSHFMYSVKTIDNDGLESSWGDQHWFWVNQGGNPPEPFAIYAPEDDIYWVDYYSYFSWGNTVDYDPSSSFTFTFEISPDSQFIDFIMNVEDLTDTTLLLETDSLAIGGSDLYWRVLAIDNDGLIQIGGLPEPQVRKLHIVIPGDANGDGLIQGSDVTYLVSYFRGIIGAPNPILAGDANGSCATTGSDVTYLVNFFRGVNPIPSRVNCIELPVITLEIPSEKVAKPKIDRIKNDLK